VALGSEFEGSGRSRGRCGSTAAPGGVFTTTSAIVGEGAEGEREPRFNWGAMSIEGTVQETSRPTGRSNPHPGECAATSRTPSLFSEKAVGYSTASADGAERAGHDQGTPRRGSAEGAAVVD